MTGETPLHQSIARQYAEAFEELAEARELLANREAKPVGFYTTVSGRKGVIWHNGAPEDDTAIYTALPAPAVPEEADLDSARMAVGFNRYIQAGYVDGWNACRAAMPQAALDGGK